MKLTCAITAIVVIFADATQGFRLPAIFQHHEQQQPKCSLYSGFKDSPSFTSFCKQLPRATRPVISAVSTQATATSSAKKTPSISTQLFTFDGGRTSTMSPVNPAISSAAASKTFELPNYTITTSGQLSSGKATTSSRSSPTDLEVNCYISGSKLPASECTRTAGLTRHDGYTYSSSPKPNTKPVSTSSAAAASSNKVASSGTSAASTKSNTKPVSTSSAAAASSSKGASFSTPGASTKPASSSSRASSRAANSSGAASSASKATTSAIVTGASSSSSGMSISSKCTRTMNLTHVHGYTYSAGTAPGASTAKLTSSVVAPSSSKSATSSASKSATNSTLKIAASSTTKIASSSTTTSAPLGTGASSTFSTAFVNSYDCNNITAAEPHRMGSSTQSASTTSAPSSQSASSSKAQITASSKDQTTSSKAQTTSSSRTFVNSYDCNNITAAEPHRMGSSTQASQSAQGQKTSVSASISSTTPAASCSSTTTVIDATVTTFVPCATNISKPPKAKRDPAFMKATAGGICDAGVYCVNSTFVSDAPPSWHWDTVALKQGQACLEDNVFNTEWVEAQCACAGL